jgi:DivIVA domain-containing protein
MSAFQTVGKRKLGYSTEEVDSFIVLARDQYNNLSSQILDWRGITTQKFTMVKGGYDPASVDSAIDKLQDSFAERELNRDLNQTPRSLSGTSLADLRTLLLGRVHRPNNRRFSRMGVAGVGYSRKEVDALMFLIQEFLEGQESLFIDQVRSITFKVTRGGYVESQVDSYIERLVEYLQTRRFGAPVVVSPIPDYGFTSNGSSQPAESHNPYSEF